MVLDFTSSGFVSGFAVVSIFTVSDLDLPEPPEPPAFAFVFACLPLLDFTATPAVPLATLTKLHPLAEILFSETPSRRTIALSPAAVLLYVIVRFLNVIFCTAHSNVPFTVTIPSPSIVTGFEITKSPLYTLSLSVTVPPPETFARASFIVAKAFSPFLYIFVPTVSCSPSLIPDAALITITFSLPLTTCAVGVALGAGAGAVALGLAVGVALGAGAGAVALGVAVGVALGLAVGVALGAGAVGVALGLAVGVALGLAVGVALGLAVGVALGLAVGVALGLAVGVALGLAVGVALGLAVGVALGLAVGVALGSAVGVALGSAVGDGVGVAGALPSSVSEVSRFITSISFSTALFSTLANINSPSSLYGDASGVLSASRSPTSPSLTFAFE